MISTLRELDREVKKTAPSISIEPRDPRITFEASAIDLKSEPVVFFAKQFFSKFNTAALRNELNVELDKIDKILAADPYFNGGKGQTGKKVITASVSETIDLIDKYSNGALHGGAKIEPLSESGKVAFKSLVAWFIEYRNSFPDPTETGSLATNLFYLRQTLENKMKWGICLTPDPHSGRVAAAFSGQVLEIPITKSGEQSEHIKFTWGEHLFVVPEFRRSRLGQQLLDGLDRQMEQQFGMTAFTLIEVDNPYALVDSSKIENNAYFDFSRHDVQNKLWTDPNGMNMAMDPFVRMRFWHKLGFSLLVVERKDLPEKDNSVTFPYNQVPLSKGGDPCETVILAVRIEDEKVMQAINSGAIGVKEFKAMYDAMQTTVSQDFRENSTYKASIDEISRVGIDSKVKLVHFCNEDRKSLNPEALAILKRTAEQKITEEKYKSIFQFPNLNTTLRLNEGSDGSDRKIAA